MRQLILGSYIGRLAMAVRARSELFHAACCHPELVGMVANDQLSLTLVTRLCKSEKTFIDVGAHLGSVLSVVRFLNPTVSIVAIEADVNKSRRLRTKWPEVIVHNVAAGDKDEEVLFFIDSRHPGCSSLQRPTRGVGTDVEVTVSMRRLDDLIREPNLVDVMKIDVEGAELIALRGSAKILAEGRPTVMFESGAVTQAGIVEKQAIWQYLASCNYAIVVPNRVAHNGDGLSCEGFLESHIYPRRTTNYFAIPLERRTEIRNLARIVLDISAE